MHGMDADGVNKTVMITGCSSGFGLLACERFLKEGWNVIVTMRDVSDLKVSTESAHIAVYELDVCVQGSVDYAISSGMERFGKIDVLVNNAGVGGLALLEQASDEMVRRIFETNVFGLIRMCRGVMPQMRLRKSGKIINISSMADTAALPLTGIYSASKHAVTGFSRALALECGAFGVRVHVISPGSFPTNFTKNSRNCLAEGDEALVRHGRNMFHGLRKFFSMVSEGGQQEPSSMEVADAIFECANGSFPFMKYVGCDAEMIAGMANRDDGRELEVVLAEAYDLVGVPELRMS